MQKHLISRLLPIVALALSACAAPHNGAEPRAISAASGWSERDASPGIALELRETSRTKQAGFTEVSYQLEIEGAPAGKTYNLYFLDLGMQSDGAAPVALGQGGRPAANFTVDAAGIWQPPLPAFKIDRFVRGEWFELRLVSGDSSVRAIETVVPFPIEGRDGPCRVELRHVSRPGTVFFVSGSGFQPDELLRVTSRSNDEVLHTENRAEADGSLPPIFLDARTVGSGRDGVGSYTVKGRNCEVTVDYEWGEAAMRKVM